ncbi:hypothetical protein F4775DRAFT_595487 [Biscogniauxia sp. FL1348]|nr:hypothetical protein F4775DRAFT_595487 [Biscogniauxia sp. FL1348]
MPGSHRYREAISSSSASTSASPKITRPRRHGGRHARRPKESDTDLVDGHPDSGRNDPNAGNLIAVDDLHVAFLAPQSFSHDAGPTSYSAANYSSHSTPHYYPNIEDDLCDGEAHSHLGVSEPQYSTNVQDALSTIQTNMYPYQTSDKVDWATTHDHEHGDGPATYQSTETQGPVASRPDPDDVPMASGTAQGVTYQAETPDGIHAPQSRRWSMRLEYGSVTETDGRPSPAAEPTPREDSIWGVSGDGSASEEHEHPLYRYLYDDQAPFVGIERSRP